VTGRPELLLITTSRRTSNRVRSFVRDLYTVMPGSERFNRGGMSLQELISRIQASGATAALVVTLYKGNPGGIRIFDSSGVERLVIRMESAALRREVMRGKKLRINSIHSLSVPPNSSLQTMKLAQELARLLDTELLELEKLSPVGPEGEHAVDIRLTDMRGGRTLWTHYHAADVSEVGPRIRVTSVIWRMNVE